MSSTISPNNWQSDSRFGPSWCLVPVAKLFRNWIHVGKFLRFVYNLVYNCVMNYSYPCLKFMSTAQRYPVKWSLSDGGSGKKGCQIPFKLKMTSELCIGKFILSSKSASLNFIFCSLLFIMRDILIFIVQLLIWIS